MQKQPNYLSSNITTKEELFNANFLLFGYESRIMCFHVRLTCLKKNCKEVLRIKGKLALDQS